MAWVLKMDDATIESGLVHDFDASLSGIGQELGAGAYSMRSETTCPLQLTQELEWWLHFKVLTSVFPRMCSLCTGCDVLSLCFGICNGGSPSRVP